MALLLSALSLGAFAVNEARVEGDYYVLSKADYADKTRAAYLAKLTSFFTDYKFVWNRDGSPRVALPDSWYGVMKGSDTQNNPYHQKVAKLFKNETTGIWESYIADAFGIDILNLHILRDMYEQYGTPTTKVMTDDWVKYDVWDMGGGHRTMGAYALSKNKGYVVPYVGRAEYGNRYSWCEEPWIETNTLGMVAAGMPNVAVDLTAMFGPFTGDTDNLGWTDYIAAMYAMAYYESDIPTLIRDAAAIFAEDSWEREVIAICMKLYKENPTDWRRSVTLAEKLCTRRNFYYYSIPAINEQSRVDINMAFSILGLLYGNGDFDKTCKIFSLSGYDARGVCFLPVLGIIGGTAVLPEEANTYLWQDGKGIIVNTYVEEAANDKGIWMHHAGLPENYKLSDIMDMFRENFERVLVENGGKIVGNTYYIPKTNFRTYDYVKINNYNFETGDLTGWTSLGGTAPEDTNYSFFGDHALKIVGSPNAESGAYQTVSGLKVGATYRLDAYALSSKDATAYLFAKGASGNVQTASIAAETEFVKRDLVFRATSATMQIGLMLPACDSTCYAIADELTLYRLEETTPSGMQVTLPMEAATVGTILNAEGKYENSVRITVDGKSAREVLLKCTFANPSNAIVDAKITVNGESFDTVPFYKTGALTKTGVDVTYIPVVLDKDVNTVDLAYDGKVLYMKNVEAVIERTRCAEADLDAIAFNQNVSTTPKSDETVKLENASVVYLGGTHLGDGSAPDKAVNNLTAAFDALDLSKDCTIVICGEFTQKKSFAYTADYTGSVTLTSVYGGVDYRGSGAAIVTPGARFVCNGKTIFKDVDFRLTGKYYCIVAQHNPLVMDTGVTMCSTDADFVGTSFANGFDIIGGYQAGQSTLYAGEEPPETSDAPVDITIKSGSHYVIAAYSRQVTEPVYNGDATIRISGDAKVSTLYFAPVNTSENNPFTATGNVKIELRGGASITNLYGTTNSATLGGLTLDWHDGTIGQFAWSSYAKAQVTHTGDAVLNYSKAAEKTASFPQIAKKFTRGTVVKSETVVYLGGTKRGDGSSPDKALGTLTAAYDALDLSKDCTIVICGEFKQAQTFVYKKNYTGSVTLTSVFYDEDYRDAGAALISAGARFVCTGKTIFKDIDFRLTGKYYCIVAQHNPLVMDTGVTMRSTDAGFAGTSFANGFDIIGGYQAGQGILSNGTKPPIKSDVPVDITIKSGSHYVIAAYSRQVTEPVYNGDATIRISGDAKVGTLYFAPVNTSENNPFTATGNVKIELSGDASITNLYGTTNSATLGGLTLDWYDGTIGRFAWSSYAKAQVTHTGDAVLNYSKAAEKTASFPQIAEQFTRGTVVKSETVVYLGGSKLGDGSSPDKALGTLTAAYDALDLSKDCTIVICGEFKQAQTFVYKKNYTGSVTLTSVFYDEDYRDAGAALISAGARFVCTGKTIFRDINFRLTGKYYCIVAQHNPLVMDTGVTMRSTDAGFAGTSFANGFDIIGGYQAGQGILSNGTKPPAKSDAPVDITIKSGSHYVIAAYSRQVTEPVYNGDATIRISGDAKVSTLYFAPVNTSENNPFTATGNVKIELSGDASITNLYGTTNSATLGGLTLDWYDGTIGRFAWSSYAKAQVTHTGDAVLNYSKAAEKTASFPQVAEKFTHLHALTPEPADNVAYIGNVGYTTVQAAFDAAKALETITIVAGTTETVEPKTTVYLAGDYSGITIGGAYTLDVTGRYARRDGAIVTDPVVAFTPAEGVKAIVRPTAATAVGSTNISATNSLEIDSSILLKFMATQKYAYADFYAVIDLLDPNGNKIDAADADPQARRFVLTDKTLDSNGRIVYVIDGIPATCMGNLLEITFYGVKADGTVDYRTFTNQSIKNMLYTRYSRSTDEAYKALIVAILNYGALAQSNFGYATDALVNADLDASLIRTSVADYAGTEMAGTFAKGTLNEGETAQFRGIGMSAELLDKVRFKITLTPATGASTDYTNLTAVVAYTDAFGTAQEVAVPYAKWDMSGSKPLVEINEISAVDLRQKLTLDVYSGYGTDAQSRVLPTYTIDGLEYYCTSKQKAGNPETLKVLCYAIMHYCDMAKAYFVK